MVLMVLSMITMLSTSASASSSSSASSLLTFKLSLVVFPVVIVFVVIPHFRLILSLALLDDHVPLHLLGQIPDIHLVVVIHFLFPAISAVHLVSSVLPLLALFPLFLMASLFLVTTRHVSISKNYIIRVTIPGIG